MNYIGGKPSKSFSSPLSNNIETYQAVAKQMAPSVKSSSKISPLCLDPKFDAIIVIDDDTYIFKGILLFNCSVKGSFFYCFSSIDTLVYRRSKLAMDYDYPKAIRDVFGRWEGGIWQTLPDHIDTALVWPNQNIFFFKVMQF